MSVALLTVAQAPADTEGTVRRLEARSDEGPSEGTELEPLVAEQVAEPSAPSDGRGTLLIGPRVGASVPATFLRPGYVAGLELHYRLPLLDRRLRLSLFGGRTESSGEGPKIVPGRGFDPAFIQNSVGYPIEALLHFELLSDDAQAVTLGAGYGLTFAQSNFAALGTTESRSALGHSALAQVAYRRRLGPGEAALSVQGALGEARFGGLGQVGTQSLSSIQVSVSWAVAVLP